MNDSHERFDSQETIELQNVVASTGIEQELDLQSVAMDLKGADYNPDNFPGIVYRTEEPRAATLMFRSGKLVSTGASSVENVRTVLAGVFDDLRKLGIEIADHPEVTVQNMVASADLGQRLNLNAIAIGLGLENVEYEPEQFPGLVYRINEPSVVALLFGSGKMVITGATVYEEVERAVEATESRLADLSLLD
jgi:transcription initiation factor TFIID TATA-box-binding protein